MGENGQVNAVNTFGADGLVSRKDNLGSGLDIGEFGVTRWYTFDERGNVSDSFFEGGYYHTAAPNVYDAYGALLWGGNDTFAFGGKYGYYTDTETGLVLCTYRYYDPKTGRWLNQDPIGYQGGFNTYAFVTGNPINSFDPLGLAPPFPFYYLGPLPGKHTKDPEGYTVIFGGFENYLNLQPRNAMTLNGATYIRDPDALEFYLSSDPEAVSWRAHEHHHTCQENENGTFWYLFKVVGGYITTLSHNNSPMEIDADNHAGIKYKNPYWFYATSWWDTFVDYPLLPYFLK